MQPSHQIATSLVEGVIPPAFQGQSFLINALSSEVFFTGKLQDNMPSSNRARQTMLWLLEITSSMVTPCRSSSLTIPCTPHCANSEVISTYVSNLNGIDLPHSATTAMHRYSAVERAKKSATILRIDREMLCCVSATISSWSLDDTPARSATERTAECQLRARSTLPGP